MDFSLAYSLQVLERTPDVLEALLRDLDESWTSSNEGPDTWSPYDVIGHLIHGERTDWIPRMMIILRDGDTRFVPFDRFAQFEESRGKSLATLLDEFKSLRRSNLELLRSVALTDQHLTMTGIHPEFGEVTLAQLLSTWVVHDLAHLAQISRVMAKQYMNAVGPWKQYITLLQ